jgi:hypothetical protein
MNHKLYSFSLSVCLSAIMVKPSSGQSTFVKYHETSFHSDIDDAETIFNDNYYIVNASGSFPEPSVILKTDTGGNVVWSKQYVDSVWIDGGIYYDMDKTSDNNLVISISDFEQGVKVFKMDTAGTVIWAKKITCQLLPGFLGRTVLAADASGIYVACNNGAGLSSFKLDNNGNLTGSMTYMIGGPYLGHITDMFIDGYQNSYIVGDHNNTGVDDTLYIVKVNANNAFQWCKDYLASGLPLYGDVHDGFSSSRHFQNPAGDEFYLSGFRFATSFNVSRSFIFKTDTSGNPLWSKALLGGFPLFYSYGNGSDGTVFLASRGYGLNTYPYLVMQLDSAGNVNWKKDSQYSNMGFGVQKHDNGEYIVYGFNVIFPANTLSVMESKHLSYGTNCGSVNDTNQLVNETIVAVPRAGISTGVYALTSSDIILTVTDNTFPTVALCSQSTVAVAEHNLPGELMFSSISDGKTIDYATGKAEGDFTISIYSAGGSLVASGKINTKTPSGKIVLGDLHDGIYFLRCYSGSFYFTKKFIVPR